MLQEQTKSWRWLALTDDLSSSLQPNNLTLAPIYREGHPIEFLELPHFLSYLVVSFMY